MAFPECAERGWTLLHYIMNEILMHSKLMADKAGSFDSLEVCAGLANVTKEIQKMGLDALALDRKYNPALDISKALGFRIFLLALRRLRTKGLCWLGLECKTYVWVGRSVFKRPVDRPLGDADNVDRLSHLLSNC